MLKRGLPVEAGASGRPHRQLIGTDPQGNGGAEKAVQDVEGKVRTLVFGFEQRVGGTIGPYHPILPRVVEWAGVVITRYVVGHDGKTALGRSKGRRKARNKTLEGKPICYKYNNRDAKCDGGCGRAHVCQLCLGEHPRYSCKKKFK